MTTIEDIYDDIGGFGLAQIIVVFFINVNKMGAAWSMMQMTFAGIIPEWYCVIDHLTLYSPVNTTDSSNSINYETCEINGTQCQSYHFTNEISTVISEWNLVCDLKYVKAMVISIQMGGVLVGAMISGYAGDQFGRKKTTYLFVLWNVLVNVVTAFCTSWPMFAAFRFLCGTGVGGILVVTYPYALEFVPLRWRSVVAILPSWIAGCSIFALMAFLLKDWSHMHLGCAALFAPLLLGWFIAPESIRWLVVQNRVDEAMEVFAKIAKRNNKELPMKTREILEDIAHHEREVKEKQKQYTYIDLMKTRDLAKTTLVFCFIWFSMSLIYYGISFAVTSFSGNYYLNIFLMTVMNLPFYPVVAFLMNKIGRRWTAMLCFAIPCAAAVGCLVIEMEASVEYSGTILNALAITARASVGCGWSVIITWGTELYPTVTRNLGFGAHNAAARVGAMVAPFVINLDEMVLVSYLVVAGLSFLVVVSCFIPAETKDAVLADSMALHKSSRSSPETKDVELEIPESSGFKNRAFTPEVSLQKDNSPERITPRKGEDPELVPNGHLQKDQLGNGSLQGSGPNERFGAFDNYGYFHNELHEITKL